jgi:hypothetical protein
METMAIVERLGRRFPKAKWPEVFLNYIEEQEKNGHQLCRVDSGEPLYPFFRRLSAPRNHVRSFLTPESRIQVKVDYHQLLQLSPDAIFNYLLDHFAHVFDLQQIALDSELPTGFNRHGQRHVRLVTTSSVRLIKQRNPLSAVDSFEKEAIIGGMCHDLGNIIGRNYHGLYGVYLLTQIFENYSADEETLKSFLAVLEIVMLHEVEFGTWSAQLEDLNPATLSTIIADKTDVGFHRVSAKSNVPSAVDDAHVVINLLVSDSTLERVPDANGSFHWIVDFQPRFDADQHALFSRLLKVTGRVMYPREWKDIYEEQNIEYLFLFQSVFLEIYLTRMFFAMRSVFTLFPSAQEFSLIINDPERGISLKRTFSRNAYAQQVAVLGKLFYREGWPETRLYQVINDFHALDSESLPEMTRAVANAVVDGD